MQKKVDSYYEIGKKVHVSLISGHWKRGIIKEVTAGFFILDETLQGKIPVFFEELKDIEIYTPKKEDVMR